MKPGQRSPACPWCSGSVIMGTGFPSWNPAPLRSFRATPPSSESDGTTAYIPTAWLEGGETFTPWEGYAGSNCKLYEDYLISGKEVKTLYTNKPLTVLWDSGLTALVQADGERFYAASTTLRQTPLVVPPPRKTAAAAAPPAAAATCGPHRRCKSQSHTQGDSLRPQSPKKWRRVFPAMRRPPPAHRSGSRPNVPMRAARKAGVSQRN